MAAGRAAQIGGALRASAIPLALAGITLVAEFGPEPLRWPAGARPGGVS
jgi:hypothetical protein